MKAGSLKYYWEGLTKRDWLLAIVLFVISFAARLPLRSRYLYSWDAGNFAAGLLDYNPTMHQPHPPGYPLYIAVGKFINIFLPNANTALVAISIICGAISVPLIYLVGKQVFSRTTGLVAAFILFVSPLVWFQSEVALAHITELPFAILAAWLLYEVLFNRRYVLATAVVIGLGGGFRQDVAMFFGPALLIGAFRIGARKGLIALLVLSATVLAWFLPFLYFVGDWESYTHASALHTHEAMQGAVWRAGISGLFQNAKQMSVAAFWLFGACSILLYALMSPSVRSVYRDRRVWFLLSLPVLPVLFFLLTSFSHYGYSLIYAPCMILLTSYPAGLMIESIRKDKRWWVVVVVSAVGMSCMNAVIYLKPGLLSPPIHTLVGSYSGGAVRKIDREIEAILDVVEGYESSTTLIVFVGPGNDPLHYRQTNYYLPEFRQVWLRPDIGKSYHDTKEDRTIQVNPLQILVSGQQQLLIFGKIEVEGQPLPDIGTISVKIVKMPKVGVLDIGPYSFCAD